MSEYASASKTRDIATLKVAVIHDWLVTGGGAEKVLEAILQVLPQAEVFTIVHDPACRELAFLQHHKVHTSFINKLPFAKTKHRNYLPLMPYAIENFDLSSFDLVLSSSYAVAKGVLTGPDQRHICYCHSPIRYAWDLQHEYLREAGLIKGLKATLARYLLHKIRLWDYRTANGVDLFLANSDFIRRRIWKVYRREATVLHPPVDIAQFTPKQDKEDFYLAASRMVPYKKIPLIVEAFAEMPDRKLVVIGEGPDFERAKSKAGPNVTLLGYQSMEVLRDHMQRAKGFVFMAQEDFGIIPLEAQACGTPVIGFGVGGLRETVRNIDQDKPTGVYFMDQSINALKDAIERFETSENAISVDNCVANAQSFAPEAFKSMLKQHILTALD